MISFMARELAAAVRRPAGTDRRAARPLRHTVADTRRRTWTRRPPTGPGPAPAPPGASPAPWLGGARPRRRRRIRARARRWRRCCWSRSCCACGGSSRACPTATTSTRPPTSFPRAIAFFSHDLNPQYFLNPPAYSYLLHVVFELWFGSGDAVARAFATDPTGSSWSRGSSPRCSGRSRSGSPTWPARGCSAAPSALLAAAIFAFAFLPVFYSHLALNDVPTLAPGRAVAVRDRRRDAARAARATT